MILYCSILGLRTRKPRTFNHGQSQTYPRQDLHMVESAFHPSFNKMGYFWNHPNDTNLLISGPFYSFLYQNMRFETCIIIIEHARLVSFHPDQYFEKNFFSEANFWNIKKTRPYSTNYIGKPCVLSIQRYNILPST